MAELRIPNKRERWIDAVTWRAAALADRLLRVSLRADRVSHLVQLQRRPLGHALGWVLVALVSRAGRRPDNDRRRAVVVADRRRFRVDRPGLRHGFGTGPGAVRPVPRPLGVRGRVVRAADPARGDYRTFVAAAVRGVGERDRLARRTRRRDGDDRPCFGFGRLCRRRGAGAAGGYRGGAGGG